MTTLRLSGIVLIVLGLAILALNLIGCQAQAQASSYGETEQITIRLDKINTNLDRIADALEEHNRNDRFRNK